MSVREPWTADAPRRASRPGRALAVLDRIAPWLVATGCVLTGAGLMAALLWVVAKDHDTSRFGWNASVLSLTAAAVSLLPLLLRR